jgi:hypothetical protein
MLTQIFTKTENLKLKRTNLLPLDNSESVYKEIFCPLKIFLTFSHIYKSSVQKKFVIQGETVDDNITSTCK